MGMWCSVGFRGRKFCRQSFPMVIDLLKVSCRMVWTYVECIPYITKYIYHYKHNLSPSEYILTFAWDSCRDSWVNCPFCLFPSSKALGLFVCCSIVGHGHWVQEDMAWCYKLHVQQLTSCLCSRRHTFFHFYYLVMDAPLHFDKKKSTF